MNKLTKNNVDARGAPRVVFASIEAANRSSPFFIDEEGVGPWLSTAEPERYPLGSIRFARRNAVHIPSVSHDGSPVSGEIIDRFLAQAASLGLDRVSPATGYWTLASTGEMQTEAVQIAWSEAVVSADGLRRLADAIRLQANQEAVAIEVAGRVEQRMGD